MSRFARVTEEVLRRHKELAVEHHKTGKVGRSAPDTFYLYLVILCHSWATGYLEMPFVDLCRLYDLEYHNSTRRLKTLREKGWIEKKGKQIRPLLIHRPAEKSAESKSVTVTNQTQNGVTVTPSKGRKSVTVTPEKCNGYTKTDEKSVTVTPENAATPNQTSDSGDAMIFKDLKSVDDLTTTTRKSGVVVGKNTAHKSIFSREEIRSYIELCERGGQIVRNRVGLETHLHQTGESDAAIQAALYPELTIPEQSVEYDEEIFTPEPLGENRLRSRLSDLRLEGLSDDELAEHAHFYTPADWAWLMAELNAVEK